MGFVKIHSVTAIRMSATLRVLGSLKTFIQNFAHGTTHMYTHDAHQHLYNFPVVSGIRHSHPHVPGLHQLHKHHA